MSVNFNLNPEYYHEDVIRDCIRIKSGNCNFELEISSSFGKIKTSIDLNQAVELKNKIDKSITEWREIRALSGTLNDLI